MLLLLLCFAFGTYSGLFPSLSLSLSLFTVATRVCLCYMWRCVWIFITTLESVCLLPLLSCQANMGGRTYFFFAIWGSPHQSRFYPYDTVPQINPASIPSPNQNGGGRVRCVGGGANPGQSAVKKKAEGIRNGEEKRAPRYVLYFAMRPNFRQPSILLRTVLVAD